MFERFTDIARRVVVLSQEEARSLNYTSIDTDHELLAMLRDTGGAAEVLLAEHGVTYDKVRDLCQPGSEVAPSGHIPFTTHSRNVLKTALHIALQTGGIEAEVTDLHLLLALFCIESNLATEILDKLGCDQQTLCDATAKQLGMKTPFVIADHRPSAEVLNGSAAAVFNLSTRRLEPVYGALECASAEQIRSALLSAIVWMNDVQLERVEMNLRG